MSKTNREIISEITNDIKGISMDRRFSKRYILSKLRDYTAFLMKRENDQLRLWNYHELWETVDCIEMESVDAVKCCGIEFKTCQFMMRSIKKFPDLFSFRGGPLIREIFSMDRSQRYDLTSPRSYQNIMNREFRDKSLKYAWLENGHLIIPDSQVMLVSATMMPIDKSKAKLLSSCRDENDDNCDSILDSPFICPEHLVSSVKDLTLQSLLNTERIPKDENPNGDANVRQGKL